MSTLDFHSSQVERLQQIVQALESHLALAETYGTPDFASRISFESTQYELRIAKERLKSALAAQRVAAEEDVAHVFLSVDRDPHGPVPLSVVGRFLFFYQSLANAVQQARSGLATARGRIQQQVLMEAGLYAVGGIAGSFGVRLRRGTEEQEGLFEREPDDLAVVLTDFFDADSFNRDSVIEMCRQSPRVFTTYRDILSLVAKSKIEVTAAAAGRTFAARMSSQQASDREAALLSLESESHTVELVGKLVGASLFRDRFELETSDGIVSGRTAASVPERVASDNLFGKRVVAVIVETVETQAEGLADPICHYELIDVRPFEQLGPSLFPQADDQKEDLT